LLLLLRLATLVDGYQAAGAVPLDVRALVQDAVDHVNADLSRPEQIKRFAILERDFSAEEGEVTPTLKLKRRVCVEHFAREVDGLYATEDGADLVDPGRREGARPG